MSVPEYNPWQVVRKIGEGSYGTVYEIVRNDLGFEQRAALKVISIPKSREEISEARAEGLSDDQIKAYFESSAQALMKELQLMHVLRFNPNVVGYEDHLIRKHEDGIGYDIMIRMELLTPMKQYFMNHTFSKADVVRLGIDICNILEYCRQNNIIHRDIKPDNIFVGDAGQFKLGDFGIARAVNQNMSGFSKQGTPNYMAPEIYHNEKKYDLRVDLYSLGITMYRLLNNGRLPFYPAFPASINYDDRVNALNRRMSGERLPCPNLDQGPLADIILKACSYKPEDRYSTPLEMMDELAALLQNTDGNLEGLELPPMDNMATEFGTGSKKTEDSGTLTSETKADGVSAFDRTGSMFFSKSERKKAGTGSVSPQSKANPSDKTSDNIVIAPEYVSDTSPELPEAQEKAVLSVKKETSVRSDDAVPAEEPGNKEQKSFFGKYRKGIIIGALLVVLLLGGGLAYYFSTTTVVPDVSGMSVEEAVAALEESSLKPVEGTFELSDKYPRDTVINVEGEGNRVKKGAEAVYNISLGQELEVPNLIGKYQEDVEKMLEACDIQILYEEAYSDTYAAGQIIGQDVAEGTILKEGSSLKLTVSKGPTPVTLESYKGKKASDVKSALEKLGLTVTEKEEYSDNVGKGKIISQEPAKGAELQKGDTVTLTVSKGAEQVQVPNVVGMTKANAIDAIHSANLLYIRKYSSSSSVAKGHVIRQSPKAGSYMDKGGDVTIVISSGRSGSGSSTGSNSDGSSDNSYDNSSDNGSSDSGSDENTSDENTSDESVPDDSTTDNLTIDGGSENQDASYNAGPPVVDSEQ